MTAAQKSSAAGAGISAFSSIAGSMAAGKTARQSIRFTGEAARQNIAFAKDDYMRRSEIAFQQEEAINRQLGQILSSNGLEAMKAEARLRASAASTGLTGASMEEVVNQTAYDQIFDNQVVIAKSRDAKLDVSRNRLADYMNFKAAGYNAAQQTKSNLQSESMEWLAGISSGLGSFMNTQQLSVGFQKAGTFKDD